MLTSLFSSQTRSKLLTVFFMSPGCAFNALQLAEKINVSYSLVWKELAQLEHLGVLNHEQKGRARYFQLNPTCPILPELRSLITKTTGIGNAIRERLAEEKELRAVFIFGSFAAGDSDLRSDIDLMLIGSVELTRFAALIALLERQLNRSINYVILSSQEWKNRLAEQDSFIVNVAASPKIMLLGGLDAV
jgi:predicted nucleotidyltransferase